MLGKLVKYEWKATWKFLLPLNLFIILMTILAYSTVQLSFFDSRNELVVITGILVVIAYVLSMFVIAIATLIYLIHRFYTSVYSDEGYLLHTLPVDKHHIIIAKVLSSAAWIILNSMLVCFSILFLFSANMEFMDTMKAGFDFYVDVLNDYNTINALEVLMTLIASLFAIFSRVLKVTACISLGQLASNHKVLSALGFYYGIYFVQRIFTLIYYMFLALIVEGSDYLYPSTLFGTTWEFTLISSLIYCAIFYYLTWYVMEKKLNLD